MTVALFLIALFYIIYELSGSLMGIVEESQGKIDVYLQDDIDEAQTEIVKNAILSIDGVKELEYISKDEAEERAKGMYPFLTKDVPDKLYPASFKISLSDIDLSDYVAMEIRGIEGVGEKESDIQVNANRELISKIIITVKVVMITILILTTVSACFIMMNSIKLMLYSRRREISIMKYVGATDTFTRAPFVIEGLIIALLSATIVILISNSVCAGLANIGAEVPAFVFLTSASNIVSTLSVLLLVLAAGIGTIGSYMSINKYLDV